MHCITDLLFGRFHENEERRLSTRTNGRVEAGTAQGVDEVFELLGSLRRVCRRNHTQSAIRSVNYPVKLEIEALLTAILVLEEHDILDPEIVLQHVLLFEFLLHGLRAACRSVSIVLLNIQLSIPRRVGQASFSPWKSSCKQVEVAERNLTLLGLAEIGRAATSLDKLRGANEKAETDLIRIVLSNPFSVVFFADFGVRIKLS